MEDILELKKMVPETAVFTETKGGFAALDFEGKHYDRVAVYRMFPNTEEFTYLSIREADEKAAEIGIVYDLSLYDEKTQAMIKNQLLMRYFTPEISKFQSIREEYGYVYFNALTNVGAVRFTIRSGGNSVARIGDNRYRITDLDGNRYEVKDITKLSNKELKQFELYI